MTTKKWNQYNSTVTKSALVHIVTRHFLSFPALPTKVPVLVTDKDRYQPGEILRANCTSPPARPATNLTIFVNEEPVSNLFLKFSS